MRLLLFNLVTDADDPILGFTSNWIAALAKRVEAIHVITMRAGRIQVPGNVTVHSVGKERGHSEPRRVVEFYRNLTRVLFRHNIDVCFSHMMPLFTVLAAPLLKARGIPVVTWYAHPRVTLTLRLGHHLSDRVVSSLSTTYPYKKDRLHVVGQGIDTDLFCPQADISPSEPPTILCVGRLSPVKGQMTLIEAAALLSSRLGRPFLVRMIGGPAVAEDNVYADMLARRIKELSLEGTVELCPPIPMGALPSHYCHAAVHVNLTPNGSGDKTALEAMSCGIPSITSNEGFCTTLGSYADRLLIRQSDPVHLAGRLEEMLSLSPHERSLIGNYLRARVSNMHSLEGLGSRLIALFQEVSQDPSKS